MQSFSRLLLWRLYQDDRCPFVEHIICTSQCFESILFCVRGDEFHLGCGQPPLIAVSLRIQSTVSGCANEDQLDGGQVVYFEWLYKEPGLL
jgi:hypothetical protein